MATKIKEIIHSEKSRKCFILAQFQLVLHTQKKKFKFLESLFISKGACLAEEWKNYANKNSFHFSK
jgi:hypothetical protein